MAARRTFSSLEKSFNAGQRVVDFAAHAVVVDHVLGVLGHGHRGARDRVAALAVAHHEHLVARHLDGVVRQRLDERRPSCRRQRQRPC
jgi:hypothetical protein